MALSFYIVNSRLDYFESGAKAWILRLVECMISRLELPTPKAISENRAEAIDGESPPANGSLLNDDSG